MSHSISSDPDGRRSQESHKQAPLFEGLGPEAETPDANRRALDELFNLARQYRTSKSYWEMLQFIGRFRFYSMFNAMLVYTQMPGARFVAPPSRWLKRYRRRIKPGSRPLTILQPKGPVMFVYDVSDTLPEPDAPELPRDVERPFALRSGHVGGELDTTTENAKRDGIDVRGRQAGSQSAAQISVARPGRYITWEERRSDEIKTVRVPIRYEVLLNASHSREEKYASLAHELGHLYCGHVGTPNQHWWPDRRNLERRVEEIEAESVCYLVCARLGLDNPSETYLASFVRDQVETPPISFDSVMRASVLIEQMGKYHLRLRKNSARAD